MIKRIFRSALFLLILAGILLLVQTVIDRGLGTYETNAYGGWNAIVSGKAKSDVLILGSSRAWVQFSPKIIGDGLGMSCYNLGVDGYTLDMQLASYALYKKDDGLPKMVVLSVDTFSFYPRVGLYTSDQFLPYLSDGIVWDAVEPYGHFHWYDRYVPLVRYRGRVDLLTKGFKSALHLEQFTSLKYRGYMARDQTWSNDFAKYKQTHPQAITQKIAPSFVNAFESFLQECRRDNVLVVVVYSPEYYEAQQLLTNRGDVFQIFTSVTKKYGVTFLDFSKDPICYDTAYFYNSQHLNVRGAELFSRELAPQLERVYAGSQNRSGASGQSSTGTAHDSGGTGAS